MNKNRLKEEVAKNINCNHYFLYKGCRNQNEKFYGKIIKCFHSIFIIELLDGSLKSFSYNDYGIGNIKILS